MSVLATAVSDDRYCQRRDIVCCSACPLYRHQHEESFQTWSVHAEFEVLDESLNYKGHRFLANRCEELYEKPGFCESFIETIHDDEAKKHPFGKMDGFAWKCCQCGAVVFTPLDQFTNAWPVQLSFSERLESKTMVLENWNNF